MTLLELRLIAFGPFTDRALDLSRAPGLHLIYGRNEAGKSTMLRAITGLLYGIPATTLDAHVHRMPDLRIGARVSDGNGTVIDLVRRKGNKNTLLDADGNAIDEAILQRLLGGVTEPLFRTMFGLDHESLRAGGEALLRGQGDVGESLFDAGVGGPGIHGLLEDLRAEADAIFRPKGQNPGLNKAIADFREAEKRSRDSAVPAEAWFTQRQEIEAAQSQREELRQRRRQLAAEQARLQRALRVLPLLAKRRELLTQRAALGDVATLGPDSSAQRAAAQREADSCGLQIQRLQESIDALVLKRDALQVPPALLELPDDPTDDLQKRLGSHRSAAGDLPRRRIEMHGLENEIRGLRRDLGSDTGADPLAPVHLPTAAQARLRALAKRQGALERDLEHAATLLSEGRARLALQSGGLESGATPEGAAPLPLPSIAVVERFATDLQRLEREEGDLRARERELRQRAAKVAGGVKELELLGDVPTEDQLRQVRQRRDDLWRELLARIDDPSAVRAAASAYETAARAADESADRLRREAERSGKLAKLLADKHEAEEELRWHATQNDELRQRQAEIAKAWEALWHASGVEARAPAEMKVWLTERRRVEKTVADLVTEVATLEQRRRKAEELWSTWRAQWTEAVAVIGLDENASAEEAETVLDKLTALSSRIDEATRLGDRINAMERDAEHLRTEVDALVARHAPDLAGRPLEDAADALVRRQREAREKARRRHELETEIEAAQESRRILAARQTAAEDTLRLLQRVAGVSSLAELEQAEQRSLEALQLDDDLRQVDAGLLDAGDGAKSEELSQLTRDVDPDSARARLRESETEMEEANDAISALDQKITRCEMGLVTIEGRTDAVEAADEAQEHAAAIRAHVQRYLRARLAVLLLEEEIERYRQQNQGPVLQRANELFPRLTLAAYRALEVGFDSGDEGVLLCVRADGTKVGVEGLSDGTRDQLYLALRLASLERYLQHNPAMPVILDDILIHFDDDRARAALQILAEFARQAQVLFFTHHARLAELASTVGEVVEHRLE